MAKAKKTKVKGGDEASPKIETFADLAAATGENPGRLRSLADRGRTPSANVLKAAGGKEGWDILAARRFQ